MDLHIQMDGALRELQERKSEYEYSLENLENDDLPRKFGVRYLKKKKKIIFIFLTTS